MEHWKDADEAIDTIVKLFENIKAKSEKVTNALTGVNQLVWYDYTVDGPDCSFYMDCRNGQFQLGKGHPGEDPDLTMKLSADLAHKCWSNKANAMLLITRGQIVVKGMAAKLLKLTPLLKDIGAMYNDTLTELGMEEKIIK
jgi:alkyl sulfatase BDS1-like metallo-beta-lactamase superfamily hydrolase